VIVSPSGTLPTFAVTVAVNVTASPKIEGSALDAILAVVATSDEDAAFPCADIGETGPETVIHNVTRIETS
jgi:hypothetical protein